jgi:hypothetical protein
MKNLNSKLIDKVTSSLDWDAIFEVNNCFKQGVGHGTSAIPGVRRKTWSDGITKADLKNELKSLLRYVIENDIAELAHGYWLIFWDNVEWKEDQFEEFKRRIEDEEIEGEDKFNIVWEDIEFESTLEVIYSPQRICVVDNTGRVSPQSEDSDISRLELMLEKALSSEQYELASKIKDVINLQKSQEESDK